ncbi:mannose-6-phosphate isomerase, class I [Bacillus massilinigeriensis]|uniref:mannose-6-phosphate isomerase, class I n=1 Tax=Bacillus massilionigeriensis TaxID=1805475 RepID=UPI00096AFCD9|nr:mannose-6-phosphate isomerase, class I [Bacillus massilionigeriensis]
MQQEIMFLKPFFQERLWGGTKLNTLYDYKIPNQNTGEAWVISAHKNGSSEIINGALKGKNLMQAWEEHPELFGGNPQDKEFPLLVKILDANDNLSVQVHPDDEYARNVENEEFGKTECWYVLDCEDDAEIILGHNAKSPLEFRKMVEEGKWGSLLQSVKVKKGDFFYVPSGTIHGIGKGIVILETQQNSDLTYRVYDYDRKDTNGVSRELHLDKAIDVTSYPDLREASDRIEKIMGDLHQTRLVQSQYFSVYHWKINGISRQSLLHNYLLVSVINGEGEIVIGDRSYDFKKGDNFILLASVDSYEIVGNAEFIVSHE